MKFHQVPFLSASKNIEKKIKEIFKNLLTNHTLCDIIISQGREPPEKEREKENEKIFCKR
jgi:hypothetical protein